MNKIKFGHHNIVSIGGEYFKDRITGEWLSELEVQSRLEFDSWLNRLSTENGTTDYVVCSDEELLKKYEEEESNKYY